MPPKKKSTNKKKGKQKGSGGTGGGRPKTPQAAKQGENDDQPFAATADDTKSPTPDENVVDVAKLTSSKPTISIDCANAYASLFTVDYPPKMTIRLYIKNNLTKKEITLADKAYEDCSSNFNKGINQFYKMSDDPSPDNSRWHIAQVAFLDALECAMKYPGVFLKTTVSHIIR